MPKRRYALSLLFTVSLAGCASPTTPVSQPSSAPIVVPPDGYPQPDNTASAPVELPPVETPLTITPPLIGKPITVLPRVPPISAAQGRATLDKVLPAKIRDRAGWAEDIFDAFTALKLPYTAENFCAAAAVIEQESSWQSDPTVPGLPKIVWGKIGEKAAGYHIPLPLVKTALLKPSPNGRSYKERIDTLRTEKQMNELYEDMSAEAEKIGFPTIMKKNPIRTGGPMQVSVEFAEAHVRAWPYPYSRKTSLRNEVFSRRGGVYFGSAILLQYPAPYKDMLYRFADFNAGRYSSRNAAFQAVINRLSGRRLARDGDLLSYENGQASGGSTLNALQALDNRLGMSDNAIMRDLKQEKLATFGQTELYRKVYALADPLYGGQAPREQLPQIDLKSPKITRKLTTEWFAERVNGRYQTCLQRAAH
ncbi:DUF1615 domain-containing protein [Pseudogulbenkiania ferrooxidans]|uniref:Lipoprotein n=1 Tax=Pseudogulbenkiania ferrooxidans 2002 TaxID=279714 RepID=B9Z6G0_9NEIS|nr:DUF1615 domain-containing protein [Pseudogulbenkiania ferrooxidans]EEG07535.1 protein of unknown function DUF1615 [Pseudogulbenkiania ferrooxidans 2002]